MIYQFKKETWFRESPETVQAIGETLESIRLSHDGHLSTEDVVQEAEEKTSPLHKFFEWDNAKAGHHYRIHQAGVLVKAIEVKMEGPITQPVPYFVSVRKMDAPKATYIPAIIAMNTPYFRNQILTKAVEAMDNVKKRYGSIQQLQQVFAVYEKTKRELLQKEQAAPKIKKVKVA